MEGMRETEAQMVREMDLLRQSLSSRADTPGLGRLSPCKGRLARRSSVLMDCPSLGTRRPSVVRFREEEERGRGLSLPWVRRTWLSWAACDAKAFPQCLHLKGRSPECWRMCVRRILEAVKA
ncbi:hypothetical protein EYF80_000819 [Liparis tanakae]|uniref:Uncharacterized protein n=1 Tax=Liparis tanakae TaxID=230148 RepID=A0A4Z2JG43_9TELE|nr:hypothetical protein EYF80_000819 [Liparis tanakae]